MSAERKPATLQRFFAGLAEYAFETRLGIADPPLVDYLAALLTRFIHCDAIFAVRNPVGGRLDEVSDMLVEAQARVGEARSEVLRQVGDFTLFWTGVYPEALLRLRGASRKDYLVDYCAQGKRAYHMASTLRSNENEAESLVLQRLSHDFEVCVQGLGEVRREWERREPPDAPRGLLWLN